MTRHYTDIMDANEGRELRDIPIPHRGHDYDPWPCPPTLTPASEALIARALAGGENDAD